MIANRGPLGLPSNRPTIDPGTMARVAAARPGVACASRRGTLHHHNIVDVPSRPRGPYRRELQIETLHIGNTGASVLRLQLNLNHDAPVSPRRFVGRWPVRKQPVGRGQSHFRTP